MTVTNDPHKHLTNSSDSQNHIPNEKSKWGNHIVSASKENEIENISKNLAKSEGNEPTLRKLTSTQEMPKNEKESAKISNIAPEILYKAPNNEAQTTQAGKDLSKNNQTTENDEVESAITQNLNDLDLSDLTPEEIAAIKAELAALEEADSLLDERDLHLNSKIEDEDEKIQIVDADVAEVKNSTNLEKTVVSEESHNFQKAQNEVRPIQNEQKINQNIIIDDQIKQNKVFSSLSEVSSIKTSDKKSENALKINLLLETLDKNIEDLEHARKTNPSSEETLNKYKEVREALRDQLSQGKSNEEILKGIMTPQGVSLSDLSMDDFEETLTRLNFLTFNFNLPMSDSEKDKDRPSVSTNNATKQVDPTRSEDRKEVPKEKIQANYSLSEQLLAARLKEKDKTEDSNKKLFDGIQKLEVDISQRRRKQEVDDDAIQKSSDEITKLEDVLKYCRDIHAAAISDRPVKKQTDQKIIKVITLMDSIPGPEKSPALNIIRKEMTSIHKEFTQALGGDSTGGKGTRPEVRDSK